MHLSQAYSLCVHPGDTVFDVGANVGQTARVLSPLVGPHGRCVSFECHPLMFARLSIVAGQPEFENVLPFFRALSRERGHVKMFAGTDAAACEASTIMPELANSQRLGAQILQFRVETDTIDNVVAATGHRPSFIKIDVEGAEEHVLAGATQVLADVRPKIVFEFGHKVTTQSLPPHFAQLREAGYTLFIVDLTLYHGKNVTGRDMVLQLLEAPEAALMAPAPMGGNLLTVHASQVADLRARFATLFGSTSAATTAVAA